MNKSINLAEILKNAPKGTKLWSPMLGDCYFEEYQERESTYPIKVRFTNHHKETDYKSFSIYGKAVEVDSAECVLFPSRENPDWSIFKIPLKNKHFEPFQKILVVDNFDIWRADLYDHYDEESHTHCSIRWSQINDNEILPYDGNEDKLGKTVERIK